MGNQISTALNSTWDYVKETVGKVFREIAPPIVQYVVKHPIRTAFQVANFTLLFFPGLLFAPVLGLLGWTAVGVRAGSIAAGIQSTIGATGAGGVFATLQSVAMRGYGAARLASAASAAAAAAEGVKAAVQTDNRGEMDMKREDTE
ncbi:hypothetical protein K469DRAFT_598545 [Zopfia rhizophila CBS 207.26]|uniref:Uncharacterized protein n=1 Tax=Zopfia rhizophila CBS 207.26 TaxID=1314779 RepID=A0A6A6DHU0_9PEZI|nr:hypothetical protein K469DRAFT_598545 [Zopfia rhizophila CBS 207.26]